jgi:TonB family protein
MSLKDFAWLAFLVSTLAAAPLSARAPTGKWNVNFADAQCMASRDYGTPEDRVELVLKAPAIGGVMQVAIVRKSSSVITAQTKALVTLDGAPPFKASMLVYTPRASGVRVYTTNMPAAEFDRVRQAREMAIRTEGLDEHFTLSQMTPLRKIVDDCVADLRRVFNVGDPTGQVSPLKRRAETNLARIFSDWDYPRIALDRGDSGIVKFALLIDESGRVVDCTVIQTSGAASLDSQACAIIRQRAHFRPAEDSDGKPAKDAITGSVSWRL